MSKIKSELGIRKLLNDYQFNSVIDIGCGRGDHTKIFRQHNKQVTPVDFVSNVEDCFIGDYMLVDLAQHDCIWASHVLEHQLNPNLFLVKTHKELREGGLLAITVPPLKQRIVGGHLSLWNMGLLIYHLIIAGYDCRNLIGRLYNYNITIIVPKKSIQLPKLKYDKGDLETLRSFAPRGFKWRQGFNGSQKEINWKL